MRIIGFILAVVLGLFMSLEVFAGDKTLYLMDQSDTSETKEVVRALDEAKEGDTITLVINSFGGNMHNIRQIIKHMNSSKATIVTQCDVYCYSAGGMVLMSGDEIIIEDESDVLIHLPRYYVYGQAMLADLNDGSSRYLIDLLVDTGWGACMSNDEVIDFLNGIDIIISGENMRKRLKNGCTKTSSKFLLDTYEIFRKKPIVDSGMIPKGVD